MYKKIALIIGYLILLISEKSIAANSCQKESPSSIAINLFEQTKAICDASCLLQLADDYGKNNKIFDDSVEGAKKELPSSANFDLKASVELVKLIQAGADDANNTRENRSKLYLALSSIQGIISWHLRANGGTAYGKAALVNMKLAIQFDETATAPVLAYATTIHRMTKFKWAVRPFIERAMSINLKTEAKFTSEKMLKLGQTANENYADLKKFSE